MTDLVELRAKAAIEIRSLLVSTPIGLTASQLKSDYFMYFGSQLPYRELGYYGVEDMAKDMPDVMRIKWEKGTLILLAVANESTEKISYLVSRQRLPEKAKKEQRRRSGYHRGSSYSQRSSRLHQQQPQYLFVPASVRTQVTHLLKSYRIGLRLSGFEGAFSKRFGTGLNFRQYGFKSLLSFMNFLQDQQVIILERTLDSDYTVFLYFGSSIPQKPQAFFRPPEPLLGPMPHKQFQPVINRPPPAPKDIDVIENSDDDVGSDESYDDGFGDEDISSETKAEIQQLLSNHKDGILASKLKVAYKNAFQKELDFREMGFLSVIQFIGALSDIVRVERPSLSDWLLFDRRIPPRDSQRSRSKDDEEGMEGARDKDEDQIDRTRAKFDNAFKESLRQVLLQHKDGVLLGDLLDVYEKSQGKKLNAEEFGFPSFETLLLSLMDKYLNITYIGNRQMKVSAIDFPTDSNPSPESGWIDPVRRQHRHYQPAEEPCLSYPKRTLPHDVVGCGAHYSQMPLNHLDPKISKGKYTELYVANIVSPGRFWLQLRGKSTTGALEDLMEALDFYGTSEGEKYRMPESYICVGMPCAVVFPEDGNWHRGVIVGMKDMDSAEVYYVDYGNTCKVAKSDLRLLRMKYLRLPCQAILARLSHLAPFKNGWPAKSLTRMMFLVGHKPVIGIITDIKEEVVSVVLVDTSTEDDIHVNDTLAAEGYGVLMFDESYPPLQQVPEKLPELKDGPIYIQPNRLTREHIVHLVNHNDKAYLISAEISAFFWDTDMLRSVLRKKRLDLKREVISIKLYPELFNQLKMYNVKGIWDGNNIRPCITLYELSGVSAILDNLNHPSEKLNTAILDLNASFNPHDNYWKNGKDTNSSIDTLTNNVAAVVEASSHNVAESFGSCQSVESGSSTDSDSADGQLRSEELKVMLHTLQLRRNRLLSQMIGGNLSEVEAVDQIELIEEDKQRVRNEIQRLESTDKRPRFVKHPPGLVIPQQTPSLLQQTSESCCQGGPSNPPVQVVTPTMSKKEGSQDFGSLNDSARVLQQNSLDVTQLYQMPSTGLTGSFPLARQLNPNIDLQQQNLLLQSLMLPQGTGINPAFAGFGINPALFPGLQDSLIRATSSGAAQQNLIQAALQQQQQQLAVLQQQPQLAGLQQQQQFLQYSHPPQTALSPQVACPSQATPPRQVAFNPNQPTNPLLNSGLLVDLLPLLRLGSSSGERPHDPFN